MWSGKKEGYIWVQSKRENIVDLCKSVSNLKQSKSHILHPVKVQTSIAALDTAP